MFSSCWNRRRTDGAPPPRSGGLAIYGTTADVLALAAALSQSWADVALSGAVTAEQLSSNLESIALGREGIDWPAQAHNVNARMYFGIRPDDDMAQ